LCAALPTTAKSGVFGLCKATHQRTDAGDPFPARGQNL